MFRGDGTCEGISCSKSRPYRITHHVELSYCAKSAADTDVIIWRPVIALITDPYDPRPQTAAARGRISAVEIYYLTNFSHVAAKVLDEKLI